MNNKELKEKYNQLDLFKFIMAIIVVAIHTAPLINCYNETILTIYNNITSLAVPFFFLSAGFLLGKKLCCATNEEEKYVNIKKYLYKMLKLYIYWSIIYLPLAIVDYIKNNYTISYLVLSYIKNLFLVGEHYNSYVLWYLLATIYATIFILIMTKLKVKRYKIIIISVMLFLIGSCIDVIISTQELPFDFLVTIKEIIRRTIVSRKNA